MMFNGHFLGGVANGLNMANEIALQRERNEILKAEEERRRRDAEFEMAEKRREREDAAKAAALYGDVFDALYGGESFGPAAGATDANVVDANGMPLTSENTAIPGFIEGIDTLDKAGLRATGPSGLKPASEYAQFPPQMQRGGLGPILADAGAGRRASDQSGGLRAIVSKVRNSGLLPKQRMAVFSMIQDELDRKQRAADRQEDRDYRREIREESRKDRAESRANREAELAYKTKYLEFQNKDLAAREKALQTKAEKDPYFDDVMKRRDSTLDDLVIQNDISEGDKRSYAALVDEANRRTATEYPQYAKYFEFGTKAETSGNSAHGTIGGSNGAAGSNSATIPVGKRFKVNGKIYEVGPNGEQIEVE